MANLRMYIGAIDTSNNAAGAAVDALQPHQRGPDQWRHASAGQLMRLTQHRMLQSFQ